VASCIGDDYETLDSVVTDVRAWAVEDGVAILTREEVLAELSTLIQDGYASAYYLSSQPPHSKIAEFSAERADDLWFTLTPKGVQMLRTLDIQSGHSPSYD
jgi:hypothetical protein